MSETEGQRPIDLAAEADFQLGALVVCPSSCRVRSGAREERIEPKVMECLLVLVRAEGHTVSRDRLVDLCWGGRAVSDDAINRIIAKVRRLARDIDPPPFVVETTPKVGFRLIRADGAAEPAKPHAAPEPADWRAPLRRIGLMRLALAAVGVLGLIGVGVIAALSGGAGRDPRQNGRAEVVAIQPMQPELAQLATLMSEAVVRRMPGLSVVNAQGPLSPDAGGAAGGAEFRVTGFLDQVEGNYVATAQVLDRASGVVLWSGRLERPTALAAGMDELFAGFVGGVLACMHDHRPTAPRRLSEEELSLLLHVCEAAIYGERDGLEAARNLVRTAPDLAFSHAFLAGMTLNHMDNTATETSEIERAHAEARAAAQRALRINPNLALGHLMLARIAVDESDFVEAGRRFDRLNAIDPDLSPVIVFYDFFLRDVGRVREARILSERGARMNDPRMIGWSSMVAFPHAMAGDMVAATAALDRMSRTHPQWREPLELTIAMWWDDPAVALARVRAARPSPWLRQGTLDCFAAVLPALASDAHLDALPSACAELDPDWRVRLMSRIGDVDGAHALYAELPLPARLDHTMLFYPEMRAFRRDPRFIPLAREIGLYDYWRESGHWPDFCAEPDLPYDCRNP